MKPIPVRTPFLLECILEICRDIFWSIDSYFRVLQSNIQFVIFSTPSPVPIAQSVHSTKLLTEKKKELEI